MKKVIISAAALISVFLMGYGLKSKTEPKKYFVVTHSVLATFESNVGQKLGEGWQCVGGVETFELKGKVYFAQAMKGN